MLKLYLPEPRAAEAVAHVNASGNALIAQLEADLRSGVFERATVVWPDVFAAVETLSSAHGVSTLCRSLDLLHVALAQILGATEFCTFDHRQSLMARAAGLTVLQ